jgi:hypothetical protein
MSQKKSGSRQKRLTLIAFAMTFFALSIFIVHQMLSHPIWIRASVWKMESFTPSSNYKEWLVTPFYYVIGGWPKFFDQKPVFYTIPYEAGPPKQFLGHIIAHWKSPDINLVLEGPKTPHQNKSFEETRDCFLYAHPWSCITIREDTLSRHVDEIKESIAVQDWSLRWFQVENQLIPEKDRPQGIYLQAIGISRIQDRFILISRNGAHQSIILSRPMNSDGQKAFSLLQKTIASLRNLGEIESGKAWINEQLKNIRLKKIVTHTDLALVQSLLISKISVEPSNFDSYFHLAGTSLLLVRKGHEEKKTSINNGMNFAFQNLKSSYRFAKDVAPSDLRMRQIENLVFEAEKEVNR